ncbi:MAG: hypothetical protein HY744_32245 [Deltaproteobacteria bacterium]|nr:hypothetical protein [Deltaproteobacteria bacterium]
MGLLAWLSSRGKRKDEVAASRLGHAAAARAANEASERKPGAPEPCRYAVNDVDAAVEWIMGRPDLASERSGVLAFALYHDFHKGRPALKSAVPQAQYDAEVAACGAPRPELGDDARGWHVFGADQKDIGERQELRRIYMNVQPAHACAVVSHVAARLAARTSGRGSSTQFQCKIPRSVTGLARTDAAVLCVHAADYADAKALVLGYAAEHPEAFVDGTPRFTKPIGRGIAAAPEPTDVGLKWGDNMSYSSSRAQLVAEAYAKTPATSDPAEKKKAVRAKLAEWEYDAERPWVEPGGQDDL